MDLLASGRGDGVYHLPQGDGGAPAEEEAGAYVPYELVVGGDDARMAIAAASILAKEHRDALVRGLVEGNAAAYGGYGWERNVCYGTAEHIKAIKERGLTDQHRRSFVGKIVGTAYG